MEGLEVYISRANRGRALENAIEAANRVYEIRKIALIHKVPTPVKVRRQNSRGIIIEGWFERKSTVDYHGIASGKPIAFDCKSTREKTRFPLNNIEPHQYEYLKQFHYHQGISFLVVEFAIQHEIYILKFEDLEKWWNESKQGGRKSIPYQWFVENCERCKPGRGMSLDYLAAVGL